MSAGAPSKLPEMTSTCFSKPSTAASPVGSKGCRSWQCLFLLAVFEKSWINTIAIVAIKRWWLIDKFIVLDCLAVNYFATNLPKRETQLSSRKVTYLQDSTMPLQGPLHPATTIKTFRGSPASLNKHCHTGTGLSRICCRRCGSKVIARTHLRVCMYLLNMLVCLFCMYLQRWWILKLGTQPFPNPMSCWLKKRNHSCQNWQYPSQIARTVPLIYI